MQSSTDNRFLSISVQSLPESRVSGYYGIDGNEVSKLVPLVSEIAQTISTFAVGKCYKYKAIKRHFATSMSPYDFTKGTVTYDLSFINNKNYQKTLLLEDTECNAALLKYIESAVYALHVEEQYASRDKSLLYDYSESLGAIVVVKGDTIYYSIKTFPKFVKSLGDKLKRLRKLNSGYDLLVCNQLDHFFANTVNTYLSAEKCDANKLIDVTGKITPVYISAILQNYKFIDYYSGKEYTLYLDKLDSDNNVHKKILSILDRIVSYSDYVILVVEPIQYSERGRDLPISNLSLVDIKTKTRESREDLSRYLSGLLSN